MSLELIREVETLYTMPCPLNMQAFHKYAVASKDGLSRREFKLAMLYLQGYKPAKVRIPALPCHAIFMPPSSKCKDTFLIATGP